MEKKFGGLVENKKISTEDQQDHQSGIGMLLYQVKHLCPNLANETKKLSKANNGTNPVAYKELLHVIRYVINMKNFGLKIEPTGNPNESWEIICFSDSNYAEDPVNR